jgi:hypothetical protein
MEEEWLPKSYYIWSVSGTTFPYHGGFERHTGLGRYPEKMMDVERE